jgi:hypothetical protein
MHIRRYLATSFLTLGLLAVFAASLQADDLAYMIGAQYGGNTSPFGTVDLNSGAFTLIGNMGPGSYTGLAVANGVVYTEQNGILFSVNTSNGSLTQIGGITGNNLATFGSTTTGLYGLYGSGSQSVATLFSINPQTGAITAIGPIGSSIIGNGQGYYARFSSGSSTLYMENGSNLYTINTATGAATQVGTTDSNGYLTSVLLFESGTYYTGSGSVFGTINTATGQIDPHSSVSGGPGSIIALAPLSSSSLSYYFSHFVFAENWESTLTYNNYSPQPVTCTTNFYAGNGTPLAVPFAQGTITTRTDVLAPGGSIHDQTTAPNTGTVVPGWAEATCTGPVQASMLFREYTNGVPLDEAGVNAETAPTTEFATFAQTKTGVAYANPSTTQSATITFTAYNNAGTLLGQAITLLGPLAHGASNVGPLLGLANFTGMVKITSTIPIISLSLNFEAAPIFSSLPPGDLPSTTVLVTP